MPKIHKYKNKAGFYIKSTVNRSITTYQVTEKGYNYLISKGYKDKADIDINFLMKLKDWNYIFTHGEGPGDIDKNQTYFSKNNFNLPNKHRTNAHPDNLGMGCLLFIILFILLFYLLS